MHSICGSATRNSRYHSEYQVFTLRIVLARILVNFRTLDLNLLRVFDAVMAERNLTRAARNLAMTQSAVSNALRRLRSAMGDELLVRAGYGVRWRVRGASRGLRPGRRRCPARGPARPR